MFAELFSFGFTCSHTNSDSLHNFHLDLLVHIQILNLLLGLLVKISVTDDVRMNSMFIAKFILTR